MKVTLPMIMALTAATATEGRRYLVPPQHHRQALDTSFDLVTDMLRDSPMMYNLANTLMRDFDMGSYSNTVLANPHYAVRRDADTGRLTLSMELPGVSAQDLDVHVENDTMLRIHGKRQLLGGNNDKNNKRNVMEFDQSFQLDADIDPASLQVTLRHGVLHVTAAPRVKKVQRLEIQTQEDDETPAITQDKEETKDEDLTITTEET